jgi:hypothetical protein
MDSMVGGRLFDRPGVPIKHNFPANRQDNCPYLAIDVVIVLAVVSPMLLAQFQFWALVVSLAKNRQQAIKKWNSFIATMNFKMNIFLIP